MPSKIFLARTEEQRHFRQTLKQLKKPNYFFKRLRNKNQKESPEIDPYIYLFYGEGGMGKTTLMLRLKQLIQEEFARKFHTIFLDWEQERKWYSELQVGHDSIRPEVVLKVLVDKFYQLGWQKEFESYQKVVELLQKADKKIEKRLNARPKEYEYINEAVNKVSIENIKVAIRCLAGKSRWSDDDFNEIKRECESFLGAKISLDDEVFWDIKYLVESALDTNEFEIYERPLANLTHSIGNGLKTIAQQKPLIIFMDTYEIVDRPNCDDVIRRIIKAAGNNVVWIIAGRGNLAESRRRGKNYFSGYRQEFAQEQIYAKSLSEFGKSEIKNYFDQIAPQRKISVEEIAEITRFSLGIPFVISQIAAMWGEGVQLAEIVKPVEVEFGRNFAHSKVIETTSERFLVHCLAQNKYSKNDLSMVYALAILRRPNAEAGIGLIKAMLGVEDLETTLLSLQQRYSFILVDERLLDEKLAQFLREYLLKDIRRTGSLVQNLIELGVEYLENQIKNKIVDFETLALQFEDEQMMLEIADLVHLLFWQDEKNAWNYFIPRLVEGWAYNQEWSRSLIEIVKDFRITLSKNGQHRLNLLVKDDLADVNSMQEDKQEIRLQLLNEFYQQEKRRCFEEKGSAERQIILHIEFGKLYNLQKNYQEAFNHYQKALYLIPSVNCDLLAKKLGNAINSSVSNIWSETDDPQEENEPSFLTIITKKMLENAVRINPNNSSLIYKLGFYQRIFKEYDEAILNFKRAFEIDPENTSSPWCLGVAYGNMGRTEEAIAIYLQVLEMEPKHWGVNHNLGCSYEDLGDRIKAVKHYKLALEVDPTTKPYNNLFEIYKKQKKLEEANSLLEKWEAKYPKDPKPLELRIKLLVYQEKFKEALTECEKLLEMDSSLKEDYYYQRSNIHLKLTSYKDALNDIDSAIAISHEKYLFQQRSEIHLQLGKYKDALNDINNAIELNYWNDSDWSLYIRALAYLSLNQKESAQADLESAIEIAQREFEKKPQNYQNTFNLALYHLVAENYQQASFLYNYNLSNGAHWISIHGAVYGDLKPLLQLFPDHENKQEIEKILRLLSN